MKISLFWLFLLVILSILTISLIFLDYNVSSDNDSFATYLINQDDFIQFKNTKSAVHEPQAGYFTPLENSYVNFSTLSYPWLKRLTLFTGVPCTGHFIIHVLKGANQSHRKLSSNRSYNYEAYKDYGSELFQLRLFGPQISTSLSYLRAEYPQYTEYAVDIPIIAYSGLYNVILTRLYTTYDHLIEIGNLSYGVLNEPLLSHASLGVHPPWIIYSEATGKQYRYLYNTTRPRIHFHSNRIELESPVYFNCTAPIHQIRLINHSNNSGIYSYSYWANTPSHWVYSRPVYALHSLNKTPQALLTDHYNRAHAYSYTHIRIRTVSKPGYKQWRSQQYIALEWRSNTRLIGDSIYCMSIPCTYAKDARLCIQLDFYYNKYTRATYENMSSFLSTELLAPASICRQSPVLVVPAYLYIREVLTNRDFDMFAFIFTKLQLNITMSTIPRSGAYNRIYFSGDSHIMTISNALNHFIRGDAVPCLRDVNTTNKELKLCHIKWNSFAKSSMNLVQSGTKESPPLYIGSKMDEYLNLDMEEHRKANISIIGYGQHPIYRGQWSFDKYKKDLERILKLVLQLKQYNPHHIVVWLLTPAFPHTDSPRHKYTERRSETRIQMFNAYTKKLMSRHNVTVIDLFEPTVAMIHTTVDKIHYINFVGYELLKIVISDILKLLCTIY